MDSGGELGEMGKFGGGIGRVMGRLKLVGFEVKVDGVGVLRRKRLW